jgi:MFS family permease
VADTRDRRRVFLLAQIGLTLATVVLAWMTWTGRDTATGIYLVSAISAGVGCFGNPARNALIPNLVAREHLPNALSLNITATQTASVVGPSIAGLILAAGSIATVYWINAVSFLFMIIPILLIKPVPPAEGALKRISYTAAMEGLRFIWRSPIIKPAMLLDFTATFFASANTLLPIFASEILHVGERGYGFLTAATSVGAVLTAAAMSTFPAIRRQGRVLFWAVGFYGLATVLFGLSTRFWMAFAALFLIGAADTVSMVLRQTIMQLTTPDELRGRMTSVNMLFVMGGPRLGEAEAGLAAGLVSTPFSVVSGGIGCILAVLVIAWRAPALKGYNNKDEG